MWREVLTALADDADGAGRLLLRVRRLMLAEPALRQTAVAVDAQRIDDLVARVTRAFGHDDDLAPRLAVEAAALVVRVTLDRWADAREEGRSVDLIATYAQACGHLRGLG